MKKRFAVSLLVVVCYFFPVASAAQEMKERHSAFNLYAGVSSALEKSALEVNGKNLSWGNIGGEVGFSYLYFLTDYFGLGADLHYAGFQGSNKVEDVRGRWFWHTFESDFETHTLQLMAAGRININPGSRVRLYIPFGAGGVLSRGVIKYTWDERWKRSEEDYDFSFGWFAGIGLEFGKDKNKAWGIEARYSTFSHDDSGLADDVGGKIITNSTQRNYVSLVVNLRF